MFGRSNKQQGHGSKHWDAETKRDAARRSMNEHQRDVKREDERHSALGNRQVSTAIENVGSSGADCEFDREKRERAVFEQASHERVSLGRDIQSHPKKCKLGIEPVK